MLSIETIQFEKGKSLQTKEQMNLQLFVIREKFELDFDLKDVLVRKISIKALWKFIQSSLKAIFF